MVQGSALPSTIAGAVGPQRHRGRDRGGRPIFTRQVRLVSTPHGLWIAGKRTTHFGLIFPIQNLFSEITFGTQNPLSRVLDPSWVAGYIWGSGWPPAGVPPVHLLQGGRPGGRCDPCAGLGRGPAAGTG